MRDFYLNKSILITGASSGIGFALAKKLAGNCKDLILVAEDEKRLADAMHHIKESVENASTNIYSFACDVASSESVISLRDKVLQVTCPDIIINNAGFAHYFTFDQMSVMDIEKTASVNFLGTLRVLGAFTPCLIERKKNAIYVNIASVAGAMPITPNLIYAASKSAIVSFSELLRVELKEFGINVICICPGRVITPFFDHYSYQIRNAGKETKIVTSLDRVVDVIIKAIPKKNKLVFIPSYWGLVSWWLNVDRILSRNLLLKLLSIRITNLRKATNAKD